MNKVKNEKNGKTPPKKVIIAMVIKVNLNPEIEYYCWGPLFGFGCPFTIFAGNKIEAKQI